MDTDIILYFRLTVYPLAAMGMVMSAVIEYQNAKSKLRLAIQLIVALLLVLWMVLTAGTVLFEEWIPSIRAWVMTPVITALCVCIWVYVFRRTIHT